MNSQNSNPKISNVENPKFRKIEITNLEIPKNRKSKFLKF